MSNGYCLPGRAGGTLDLVRDVSTGMMTNDKRLRAGQSPWEGAFLLGIGTGCLVALKKDALILSLGKPTLTERSNS
jgi:uncharacterized membrane protein